MLISQNDMVKVLNDGVEVDKRGGDLKITEVMTVSVFKKAYGHNCTNQTIYYHLKPKNDKLDYYEAGGVKMIIINENAEKFNPGEYYGTGRKSVTSF